MTIDEFITSKGYNPSAIDTMERLEFEKEYAKQKPAVEKIEEQKPSQITTQPKVEPVISADKIGTKKIDLPEPTAPKTQEDFTRGLQAGLEASRKQMEAMYQSQIDQLNKQIEENKKQQEEYLSKQEDVMAKAEPLTSPFRAKIEEDERKRLKIEENYFANQSLTDELESLLTEINVGQRRDQELVRTGAISSSMANKRREDAIARVGIIESVMSARNNQIGTALNFIDRTTSAIQADRQDRLNYLNSVFNFYEGLRGEAGAKVSELEQEQQNYIKAQIGMAENELAELEATSQKIKELMVSPKTAQMVYDSGIKLTDTVEVINEKMTEWGYKQEVIQMDRDMSADGYQLMPEGTYASKPQNELIVVKDSRGKERVYWKPAEEELLSVAEAKSLGVPYGTTRKEAAAMGKIPGGGEDDTIYTEKNIPPTLIQDVIDTLTDKEGAKSLGRELSLIDMIKLFPNVDRKLLQDYMDEFYDYEQLQEDIEMEEKVSPENEENVGKFGYNKYGEKSWFNFWDWE